MWFKQRGTIAAVFVVAVFQLPPIIQGAEDIAELHAVLQSDATIHDKGVACRRLAVIGNSESIPVLAELLADEQLSHFARTGLEAMPAPAVDDVFHKALTSVKGKQLVGVVNSIGIRRDSQAVVQLTELLNDPDSEVRSAAVAALGQIATKEAATVLRKALDASTTLGRTSVADACLQCADIMLKETGQGEAIALYDAVRQSPCSPHIRAAATLSAIRALGPSGVPLLREQLQSDDDQLFAVALQASRLIRGDDVAKVLLAEINQRDPQRKALVITALADLRNKQALPAVVDAVSSDSRAVRLAAIQALQHLGDGSVIDLLLSTAASDDEAAAQAAQTSLQGLSGAEIDMAIVDRLAQKDSAHLEQLIQLAGSRRITSAVPQLWLATKSSNAPIRLAALRALGDTVGSDDLDKLADSVLKASVDERTTAVAALTSACRRASDQDKSVKSIVARFTNAPQEFQAVLFELLRSVGGNAAVKHVISGANDKRDTMQDVATRALGEWPTPDVAPELLTLAKTMTNQKYQIRAIRGYIRVFRQFGLPADERLQMARQAMKVATRNDEKVLVLHALLSFQNADTMKLSIEYLNEPGLEATAAQVAIYIADQVSDARDIREAMRNIIKSGADEQYAKQARDILAKIGE